MALRGTLKDFGIADILQLIGHQGKSGVLTVRNKDQEVKIHFTDGTVVRAESSTRNQRDLLGRMLVRAEVVSEDQLTRSLDLQKRTLKRLGQLLIENGAIERKVLKTFTKLQTSETIYRLFLWENGTYEFSQQEVPADPEFDPIKSESILMEGFRQVDEWPGIRRSIAGYGLVFERIQDLDALAGADLAETPSGGEDDFGDLDFGEAPPKASGLANIGQNERHIYQLIGVDRDVQKIIDLSRLGEFETCKALAALVNASIIRALPDATHRAPSAEATVGGISARPPSRLVPAITRVVLSAAALLVIIVAVRSLDLRSPEWLWQREAWGYVDTSLQAEISAAQEQRIARALAIYRASTGAYPSRLTELVDAGMLLARDLRFPWALPFQYVKQEDAYVLFRPLY